MRNAVSSPKEKSTLYEEIPHIPWNEEEWLLFKKFKNNTRAKPSPILKECRIKLKHYRTWMTGLPEFARMETAFFPHGCKKYIFYDFLFESDYHKELVRILGMLPSMCAFFSVGNYLFARLSVMNREQEYDLFSFIYSLKEKGFYSTLNFALALFASGG